MGSYVNVFSPMTQEGAAMSNAVDAFFLSGAGPKERADRAAMARLRDEKVRTEQALQRKSVMQTQLMEDQRRGIENFLPNYAASFPGLNEPEINAYFNTGMIPTRDTVGPPSMENGIEYPPQINAFGPETERELQAGRRAYAAMQASDRSKITPEQISGSLGDFQGQLTERDLLTGDVDPTLFAISQGKMPYSTNARGTTNTATGEHTFDPYTAAFDLARAGASQELGGLRREQVDTEVAKQNNLDSRGEAALIAANRPRGGTGSAASVGTPGKIAENVRNAMRDQVQEQLTYATGYDADVWVNVDPDLENEILTIAEELYSNKQSPFYGNVRGAVIEALSQASPGGYEVTGEKTWGQNLQELVPGSWGESDPDYVKGSVDAIKRPGPPSVRQYPRTYYFDKDKEQYSWEEIEAEASEQGVTPQELIEAYGLVPGA